MGQSAPSLVSPSQVKGRRFVFSLAPAHLAEWIKACAPADTAVAVDRITSGCAFGPSEAQAIARAGVCRKNQFFTGRLLARLALGRLGCAPIDIPCDADQVPLWPEGFIGSISHTNDLCVAHVGRTCDLTGLGVDVEPVSRCEPELRQLICRSDELELEDPELAVDMAILRFVTKEAFFKAYFPATRTFLEFHDVRIEIHSQRGLFEVFIMASDKPALGGKRAFTGRFTRIENYVLAAVWIRR